MGTNAATYNATLTNYARGYSQDVDKRLCSFVAPIVATGLATGQFKRYSDQNGWQAHDTSRALTGPRKRIEFNADDPFFHCTPEGLEILIDDHEVKLAGPFAEQHRQAKIRTVVNESWLSHEAKVWKAIKAAKAATAGVGVWSNPANNDPVDEIDSQIEAITNAIGRMPNRMVFGLGAWRVFRKHSKVIARQPGAELIGLSTEKASSMFLNPQIQIEVGVLGADQAKRGAAKNAANIVGGEVWIFYGSDTPDQYEASFAKTFSVDGSLIGGVVEYRENRNVSDAYALDWSEDIQVTAPEAGRRIVLS